MDRPASLGNLSAEDWELLQDIADRFEKAWQKAEAPGDTVDPNRFLPPRGHPLRTVALHELIKIDLEMRWKRGRAIDLEQYVEKFPELGSSSELGAPLIYEEFLVRHRHGDRPAITSYQIRFPAQYVSLQKMVSEKPPHTLTMAPPAPGSSGSGTSPLRPASSMAIGCFEGMEIGAGYKLIKRIGSGGFGEVWRAEAPGGIEAAVKLIFRPIEHEEAKREKESLELVKNLRHPFLLKTQAFWQMEDRLLIVMELADGNLRDRVKECKASSLPGIPLPELIQYFKETAEALDFLHRKKVLHRDIKPDNVLLLSRHAKLADFGLARIHEHTQRSTMASGSGTPTYMAPEVWRGKVSEHSDQYALAITYCELRLDRRMWASRDMAAIMFEHLEGKPELEPLPLYEQQIITKALTKDPSQRHPNCHTFVQALEQALYRELGRSSPEIISGAGSLGEPSISPKTRVALTADGKKPKSTDLGFELPTVGVPIVQAKPETRPATPPMPMSMPAPEEPSLDTLVKVSTPDEDDPDDMAVTLQPSQVVAPKPKPMEPAKRVSTSSSFDLPPEITLPPTSDVKRAEPRPAGKPPTWRELSVDGKQRSKPVTARVVTLVVLVAFVGVAGGFVANRMKGGSGAQTGTPSEKTGSVGSEDVAAEIGRLIDQERFGEAKEQIKNKADRLGNRADEVRSQLSKALSELEENVRKLAALTQHREAVEKIEKHRSHMEAGRADLLLEEVRGKWKRYLKELESDKKLDDARLSAKSYLASFPGDMEIVGLVDRIGAPAVVGSSSTEEIKKQLADAELLLAADQKSDHEKALAVFVDLLDRQQISSVLPLRAQAELGQARAHARLGNWDRVARLPNGLPLSEKDKNLASALQALAAETRKDLPKAEVGFRDDLRKLVDGLDYGWERVNLGRVCAAVDVVVRAAAVKSPMEATTTRDDIKKLLKDAPNLTRRTELLATDQRLAAMEAGGDSPGTGPTPSVKPGTFADRLDLAKLARLKARQDKNYAPAHAAYKAAERDPPKDPSSATQLDALYVLLVSEDPKSMRADRNKALKKVESLLSGNHTLASGQIGEVIQAAASIAEFPDHYPEYLAVVSKVLGKAPQPEARVLASYLQSRQAAGDGNYEQAANLLKESITISTAQSDWLTNDRRDTAVSILSTAASRLRADDYQKPFRNSGDAEKVLDWLALAASLTNIPELDLRVNLALAAASRTSREAGDEAKARGLLSMLLTNPRPPDLKRKDLYLILFKNAEAHSSQGDDAGYKVALSCYLELFELLRREERLPAKKLEELVLDPALKLDGRASSACNVELACLHAARGELVRSNKLDNKNPFQLVFDAYARAEKLDPQKPVYVVERLFAQKSLRRASTKELRPPAESALRRAGAYPRAHLLLGEVLYDAGRDEPDAAGRAAMFRASVATFETGIQLYDKEKDDPVDGLPDLLVSCSAVYLQLGNSVNPGNEQKSAFYKAKELAARATDLPRRYQDFAHDALGNALEDIAYYLKDNVKDNFVRAIEAHTEATKLRPQDPKYWTDLGRCQYRSVAFGKRDRKHLAEAVASLGQAMTAAKETTDAWESAQWSAEASYWLGHVHWFGINPKQPQYKEADRFFQEASSRAATVDPMLAKRAVFARVQLARDEAGNRVADARAKGRKILEDALKNTQPDVDYATELGNIHLAEGDPAGAYRAYGRGLPSNPADYSARHLGLLLVRGDCLLLEKGRKGLEFSPSDVIQEADLAYKVANSSATDSVLLGRAAANAGLARLPTLPAALKSEAHKKTLADAIVLLEKAVDAAPGHDKNWWWCCNLAQQYLRSRTESNTAELKKKSIALLTKARPYADSNMQTEIDRLMGDWQQVK